MISTEEIRIRNYFNHNDEWNCKGYKGIFQWKESDWYALGECTLSLENVTPIPLTEEILLKCGYKMANPNSLAYSNDSQDLPYLYETIEGKYSMSTGIPMKYLHELQNRVWVYTGKELEVGL